MGGDFIATGLGPAVSMLASRSLAQADDIGATSGVLLVVFVSLVLVLLVLQVPMGWFVLERGGKTLAPRFLAVYLMLQAFSWAPLLSGLQIRFGEFEFRGFAAELGLGAGLGHHAIGTAALAFLPAVLIGFCLTFPNPHPWIRTRKWLLVVPFVPSTALAVAALTSFPFGATSSTEVLEGPVSGLETFRVVLLSTLAYLSVAIATSALVFHQRSRTAETRLASRRLRYMMRWIIAPTLVGVAIFLVLGLLGTIVVESNGALLILVALYATLIMLFAVVPPIAFTFGLLRYRILDLEQRVRRGGRFALRRGTLLGFFVLVSFALTELMELFIEARTGSLMLGLAAAALITVTLTPLHRSAERLTDRLIPPDDSREKGSERHRLLLYRATYEDVTADGEITARERRTLDSLARTLGLREGAASAIEEQVALERSGVPATPPGVPVTS